MNIVIHHIIININQKDYITNKMRDKIIVWSRIIQIKIQIHNKIITHQDNNGNM